MYWYAYQLNEEDTNWGTGSYNKEEALKWLTDQIKTGNKDALIAVIEEGPDPICIQEITENDI